MNSRQGTAFIIVLWLIVILGSLVSAFAIVAVHSGIMVESTRSIGQTREIARTGAEAWLGQVRAHSIFGDNDLLLTEIMPYHKHQGLQITQIGVTGSDTASDWFEVYNPTDKTLELCGYTVASGPTPEGQSEGEPIENLNTAIPPGKYIYVCSDGTECDQAFGGLSTTENTFQGLTADDGNNFPFDGTVRAIVIGQDLQPNDPDEEFISCNTDNFWSDHVVDRVSWTVEGSFSPPGKGLDRVGSEWFFITPVQRAASNEDDPMALQRRHCSQDDDEFCDGTRPLNSFNNDNDFEEVGDPDIGVTPSPAGFSQYVDSSLDHPYPTQINFFEVYNTTSDTIDIENTTYTLETDSSDDTFDLVPMPENPDQPSDGYWASDLGPNKVGVVLHPEADAEGAMGMTDLLNNEGVRAFATKNSAGNYQFPPLDQDQMDRVYLSKPSLADDQTAVFPAHWSPRDNTVYESRELFDPSDPEDRDFWAGMLDGGTPGIWDNILGIDWYGAPYGWLAEFPTSSTTGTPLSERVYLPSFEDEQQAGDIGYFRILRIEDESGKIDLRNPHSPDQFVAPDATNRHNMGTTEEYHTETYNTPAENWLSPADLVQVISSWHNEVYQGHYRSTVYSPFREPRGPRSTGLVNVNTASYEALASIPRSNDGGDTDYLNNTMINDLIHDRSRENVTPTSEDPGYPELSTTAFPTTGADVDPFTSTQKACEAAKQTTTLEVDCNLFSEFTTVVSDGVLTLEVVGVRINGQGEDLSRSRMRITVDRRELRDQNGPLEILYSRTLEEDIPDHMLQ